MQKNMKMIGAVIVFATSLSCGVAVRAADAVAIRVIIEGSGNLSRSPPC